MCMRSISNNLIVLCKLPFSSPRLNYAIICITDLQWKHLDRITSQGWVEDLKSSYYQENTSKVRIVKIYLLPLYLHNTFSNWKNAWSEKCKVQHNPSFIRKCLYLYFPVFSQWSNFTWSCELLRVLQSKGGGKCFAESASEKLYDNYDIKHPSSDAQLFWYFLECSLIFKWVSEIKRMWLSIGKWGRRSLDWMKSWYCCSIKFILKCITGSMGF